jgi:hypothetical protein
MRRRKLIAPGHTAVYVAMTCCVLLIVGAGVSAQQSQFGRAEDAKALLSRAITALRTDKAAALTKFVKGDDFNDRDLFVFCFNMGDGIFNAPAYNPACRDLSSTGRAR